MTSYNEIEKWREKLKPYIQEVEQKLLREERTKEYNRRLENAVKCK